MSEIEATLKEVQAMLTGHFLLSSGNHSSQYFQCARLLQHPDKAERVIANLAADLTRSRIDFDCIIGPAMGGIVVAYELGRQCGKRAFFTERNDEGAMCLRRGFEIAAGERVVIAEDVVTTGKSTQESADAIACLGGVIAASVCIVDRRPEGAAAPFRWPLFSALRSPAVLWSAVDCPLCREGGIPIKPGSRKI